MPGAKTMVPRLLLAINGTTQVTIEPRKEQTPTLIRLLRSVPVSATCQRWGDEIYFSVGFHEELEDDARQDMQVGDVAFWPDGDALAVFFGPTPVSVDGRPRAYGPCNIVGRAVGDLSGLKSVRSGAQVTLSVAP